jgi:hypothetical protein
MVRPCLKKPKQLGTRAHTCNPGYSGCRNLEDLSLRPAQADNFLRPYLKNTQHKKWNGMVQMTEHLLSKCEALSSNHRTAPPTKKKKKAKTTTTKH